MLASGAGRGWDFDGNSYLDFSSQLVNTNIGHQHPAVVEAIAAQAAVQVTVAPQHASMVRGRAAQAILDVAPPGHSKVFFTNGGADAAENAIQHGAAAHRPPQGAELLSQLSRQHRRSHHGHRRSAALAQRVCLWARALLRAPSVPVVVLGRDAGAGGERALAHLEQVITFEGPATIAAVLIESVVGTAGVLVPPPGYLAGVRMLCDKYGIVYIADEVMSGFGRTGAWLAIDHWDVDPDLIIFAKGSNSGYVPLGGVIISDAIAATFDDRVFPGGLTYPASACLRLGTGDDHGDAGGGHRRACRPGRHRGDRPRPG